MPKKTPKLDDYPTSCMRRMDQKLAERAKAFLERGRPMFVVKITSASGNGRHLRLEARNGRCVMTVVLLPEVDQGGYLTAVSTEANKRASKWER